MPQDTGVRKKDVASQVVQKKQLSISSVIEKDYQIDAEIWWCFKAVQSKYSRLSCEYIKLFTVMFPDSKIPKKVTLKRTKCGYVIKH